MTDRSVRVKLEADVTGFVNDIGTKAVGAVRRLNTAAATANASLARIGADANFDRTIAQATQRSTSSLNRLTTAAKQTKAATDQLDKLGSKADSAGAKVAKIGDGAQASSSKIRAAATTARGHLDKLAAAAQKNSEGFNTLASGATKVGLAATAGLALSAKAAIDWESAWAGVTKTVNGSTSQMAALEGQLRSMAKTLPVSHDQIAAVAEAAGQLGVKRQDIAAFTKTMVDLGISTNLTADEAATSIAQLMNVMGTAPQNVGRLGAALVALGNNGASTEKDIISMAQRISGSGKLIGLNEQQVLAYAAALANVGIEAEAGGSAISQVFTKIDKAVGEGGQGLSDFAKVSGMSADQYKQKWKTDASGATQAFIEGLGQIHKAGGDVNGTLATLGITEIRQRDAVLRLAESGTNLSDMLQTSNTGWRDNTALINEASKRYATTASQIQIAWNNIKDAAITAGAVMLPMIADVTKSIASLATFFGNLPAPVRDSATALTAVVAVGGLVAGAALKMVTSLSAARAAMATLGLTSKTTGAAMGALGKAGVAGIAIVGILGVVDAVNKFKAATSSADISQLSGDLIRFAATGKATGELLKNFGSDFSGVSDIFGQKGPSLAAALKTVDEAGTGLKGKLTDFSGLLPSIGNPLGAFNDEVGQSRARIGELDQALSALVQGGNQDSAAAAFQLIAAQAGTAGIGIDKLNTLFPQYGRAVGAAGVDAQIAGGKTAGATGPVDALGNALGDTGNSAQNAADALKNYIDALFLVPNLVLGVRDAQRGVQAAMDDATKSIKENGKTLNIGTDKGRANQAALDAIASSANKLSESYLNSNASQKTMTDGATSARASFVSIAHSMGMPIPAAKALAEQIIKIPKKVDTKVTNNAAAKPKTDVDTYKTALGLVPRAVPTVITNNAPAAQTPVQRYTAMLGLVPRTVPTAVTNTATAAQTPVQKYQSLLGLTPKSKSTAISTPGVETSQGKVGGLLSLLGQLPASKTVTINTYKNMIETTTHKDVGVRAPGQADGGFYPGGVPSYADGKMPDQAIIQQAVPGGLFQWAEPETQGEAFIPLAPSKRDRSTAILGQVANSFGLSLVKSFADGGFLPGGRLVDISLILKQLGVAFNPLAGINYGSTLAAQQKAQAAVTPALQARNRTAAAETAAKADVTDLSRDITLQQRYIAQLKAINPKTPKEQAANDAKVKQEQKDLIKLQDQLYAAKQKSTAATKAANTAEATYKTRLDAANKAVQAHKDAIAKLVEQQKAAVDMADQISQGLQQGSNIGDLFQQSLTGKGLLSDLQAQGADLAKFGTQITRLRKSGLSEVLIQQIVGKGPAQGMDLAQAIIDGGKSLITALNAAQKNIDTQADLIGAGSAVQKYGQAVAGARALGGPTEPGKAYLVGENGPEILRMGSQPGWVDPNRYVTGGSGGGGATTVHNHHQTLQFTGVSMAEADLIAQRANQKAELMAKGY